MAMNKPNVMLLSLVGAGLITSFVLFFRFYDVTFVDLSSGKLKSETKAFGITIGVTVSDSRLTEMTKDLNIEYEEPHWKVVSARQRNIFGKIMVWECFKSGRITAEINSFAAVLSHCNLTDDDKRKAALAFVHWLNTEQFETVPSDVFMEVIIEAYKNKQIPPDSESPFFDTSTPTGQDLYNDFINRVNAI